MGQFSPNDIEIVHLQVYTDIVYWLHKAYLNILEPYISILNNKLEVYYWGKGLQILGIKQFEKPLICVCEQYVLFLSHTRHLLASNFINKIVFWSPN